MALFAIIFNTLHKIEFLFVLCEVVIFFSTGEPLSDPEPRYDEKSGRVKCHFKGTFGKQGWELPVTEIDFPDKIERYR